MQEIYFLVSYNSEEDNEYRIILHALIVSLLLIPRKEKIEIYINKNVEIMIDRYFNNSSERRKLDHEYYLELKFIEKHYKEQVVDFCQ